MEKCGEVWRSVEKCGVFSSSVNFATLHESILIFYSVAAVKTNRDKQKFTVISE